MKIKCDATFIKDKTTDQMIFSPPENKKTTQHMQTDRCNTTHR